MDAMTKRAETLDSSPRPVKSAFRAIEILEYFAARQKGATITEIAAALGYPQSSTSMLVGSLETMGYLAFSEKDHLFSPTLRVMLLGAWQHEAFFAENSLLTDMKTLAMRTKAGVMVGLRQGTHVRFILSLLPSLKTQALWFPPGVLRPVCRSAAGKVLLAKELDEDIERIATAANAEASDGVRVDIPALIREARACRRNGWAQSLDYPRPGWANLAMGLPRIGGQPEMAVTLGIRKESLELRRDELIAELARAMERLKR
uniref:Putative transcription regulator n=2 Tax=Variovorax sp. DB1 TaxID=1179817 RepID=I3RYF4_9BURK|nr:putative transcription regulator [Variovorax sp. DB1]